MKSFFQSKINTARFAVQIDLTNVLKSYRDAFKNLFYANQEASWGIFNNMEVLRAVDDAAVYFNIETTLFGNSKAKRVEESAVGNSIINHILACTIYFLEKDLPLENIPKELRIGLGVCHDNRHWTGLTVNLKDFRQFYENIHNLCGGEVSEINAKQLDDQHRFNSIRTAILKELGLPRYADELSIANRLKIILGQVEIEHYDSMNSAYYYNRANESTHLLNSILNTKIKPIICSQQRGNTCGDHTLLNFFMASMMRKTPIVNDKNKPITSEILRTLTDSVTPPMHPDDIVIPEIIDAEKAKEILQLSAPAKKRLEIPSISSYASDESIRSLVFEPSPKLSKTKLASQQKKKINTLTEVKFQKKIEDNIELLYKLANGKARELFDLIKQNNIFKEDTAKDNLNKLLNECANQERREIDKIITTFAGIFYGEKNVLTDAFYIELGNEELAMLEDGDRIAFGSLVQFIADDSLSRLEEKSLYKKLKKEHSLGFLTPATYIKNRQIEEEERIKNNTSQGPSKGNKKIK